VHHRYGPLLRVGLSEERFPSGARAYIEEHGAERGEVPVFTSYSAGAPLGFWLAGRARVFVDSRVPLYYGDTDYALFRDMQRSEAAFRFGVARHGFRLAVLDRSDPGCEPVASAWELVDAGPRYSVFAPPGRGVALSSIRPCGRAYVTPEACDDRSRLARDIRRIRAYESRSFVDFIRAEYRVACGVDVASALDLLPEADPGRPYASHARVVRVLALLHADRGDEAMEGIEAALDDGDLGPIAALDVRLAARLPVRRWRRALMRTTELLGDGTPGGLHTDLAMLCTGSGQQHCVRYHGMRGTVQGDPRAQGVLEWLAQNHSSPRVREDALRWLEVLEARAGAAGPPGTGPTEPMR
jgi:hypothetical protein